MAAKLAANLLEEPDRPSVRFGERARAVAESRPPVVAGAPRRALENQSGAEAFGQRGVRAKVSSQRGLTIRSLQQVEDGEIGKVETLEKDERRLDAAVR
jgi:hypothetical protein